MADRALRVLCGSMRLWEKAPENFEPEFLEQDLIYVGLSGMIDPVRPEVKAAIAECGEAGIRPIMITERSQGYGGGLSPWSWESSTIRTRPSPAPS